LRDLPPDLIAAFRSTLEEIDGSRLLIHLVDAANPRWQQQIASVDRILTELHVEGIPRLLVLNKIDLIDESSRAAMLRQLSLEAGVDAIAISASERQSLKPLLDRIEQSLANYPKLSLPAEPPLGIALQNR